MYNQYIREMAVLQLLNHPGFTRLISSFRYTNSAYIVLEYAGNTYTYMDMYVYIPIHM
jgi:serine/threonine protein kinase